MRQHFYVGQPVACVDDKFPGEWWRRQGFTLPTLGARYVVRGYVDAPIPLCVLLVEITNPQVPYKDGVWRELSFAQARFRPLTDISSLEGLSTKTRVPNYKITPQWDRRRRVKETV